MKICLISRFFNLTNAGLGRIATEVANELERRGHIVARVSCNCLTLREYAWKVMWDIRHDIPGGYDVYHALSPMEALHTPAHKTVVSFNDLIPMTHPALSGAGLQRSRAHRALGYFFFTWFSYRAVKRARRVVTISQHVADELVGTPLPILAQDITVIKLGIDPRLRPMEPVPFIKFLEARHSPSDIYIGYLGQLDARKRVDLLITAFIESGRDGYLWIAGTGVERERLEELSLGARRNQHIAFLGGLSDDELPMFYNGLHLFVFPTAIEGYGLPPVEAMACGVPTVLMDDAIVPLDVAGRCYQTDNLADFIGTWNIRKKAQHRDSLWARSHRWNYTVDILEAVYREVAG